MTAEQTSYTRELEAFAFVSGVFCGSTGERRPITEEEAEYTINAWKEEGIDVPKSLNPKNFVAYWNYILCERKDELE